MMRDKLTCKSKEGKYTRQNWGGNVAAQPRLNSELKFIGYAEMGDTEMYMKYIVTPRVRAKVIRIPS